MELIDYARMIRRRGWLIGLVAWAGLLAGAAWGMTADKVYHASAELFVSNPVGPSGSAEVSQEASNFTLGRMQSYAALVDSPKVIEGIRDRLLLEGNGAEVAGQISARVLPGTVVLEIDATDSRPDRAALIANAAAERLSVTIQEIESPGDGRRSPVVGNVTRPAVAGTPASPSIAVRAALGLLVGLALGLLVATLREQSAMEEASATPQHLVQGPSRRRRRGKDRPGENQPVTYDEVDPSGADGGATGATPNGWAGEVSAGRRLPGS
jgi:succinoglycan biosynthesis transport protein ExoP